MGATRYTSQQDSLFWSTMVGKNHVSAAIAYYGLCSSTLLIVNKLALHIASAPVFLLSLQLWFAVAFVYSMHACKLVEIRPVCWITARQFAPVVLSFLGTLFANAKVLQYSNVETFITFRSSTPLVLCICDYIFLGRELPSAKSVVCLIGLLLSSCGYAMFDHAFDIRAYSWLGVWYVSFTAYEVVVKHLCDTVAIDNWTRVVYTNAMAGSMLAVAIPFVHREHAIVAAVSWNSATVSTMLASCLIGIGVSHSAYVMRSACSATLSAVVGILCKVFTVLINIVIWDKHASFVELLFLGMGLIAGALYEQAPMRKSVLISTHGKLVAGESDNKSGDHTQSDQTRSSVNDHFCDTLLGQSGTAGESSAVALRESLAENRPLNATAPQACPS
jgi:solute carrier family 35